MGLVIIGNLILIMYETDQDAKCYPDYQDNLQGCPYSSNTSHWQVLNVILLALYTLESSVRAYVERARFLCNKWNLVDLVTVILGWLSVLLADMVNLSLLRLFRLVRVLKATRVFISIPEFYLLVSGLYSSLKAILFGACMLVSTVLLAVISVDVLHPIVVSMKFDGCELCHERFSNVFDATVTIFQQPLQLTIRTLLFCSSACSFHKYHRTLPGQS